MRPLRGGQRPLLRPRRLALGCCAHRAPRAAPGGARAPAARRPPAPSARRGARGSVGRPRALSRIGAGASGPGRGVTGHWRGSQQARDHGAPRDLAPGRNPIAPVPSTRRRSGRCAPSPARGPPSAPPYYSEPGAHRGPIAPRPPRRPVDARSRCSSAPRAPSRRGWPSRAPGWSPSLARARAPRRAPPRSRPRAARRPRACPCRSPPTTTTSRRRAASSAARCGPNGGPRGAARRAPRCAPPRAAPPFLQPSAAPGLGRDAGRPAPAPPHGGQPAHAPTPPPPSPPPPAAPQVFTFESCEWRAALSCSAPPRGGPRHLAPEAGR
jgi:hypothetical protein